MENAGIIIKKILVDEGLTQAQLARMVGSAPQNLTNKLVRGYFLTSDFFEMLDVLGYEIEIKKKGAK